MTQTTEDDLIVIVDVLSVGGGDIRLSFEPGDEENAKSTIERMMRDGYQIFVEVDGKTKRVKKFNPKTLSYVVIESKTNPTTASRGPTSEVPARGRPARAIGATSGG